MFNIGQYVICGNKGVCMVEDITTLDISGVDKAKRYYILKPKYVAASTVYVSVDSATTSIRTVLSKEEAKELMLSIADIPVLEIRDEKTVEQVYKSCIRTNSCKQWVRMIKTIYERRKKRLQAGRKETAIDSKYIKLVEEVLCGELAVALGVDKMEVSRYITFMLQEYSKV